MIERAPTLFRRTALTLTGAFALLLSVVFGALAYYVTVPLGHQATEDLAAFNAKFGTKKPLSEIESSNGRDGEAELVAADDMEDDDL